MSAVASRTWELESSAGSCAACQRVLADGAACWSVLEEGAEGPVRRDYCEACRERAPQHGPRPRWRTVVREPARIPRSAIDPEAACELLERLVSEAREESDGGRCAALAYLVSLLLLRRRVLQLVGRQRNGELVVRRPGKPGRWRVAEVRIAPEELLAMDRELETLLALDAASGALAAASGTDAAETT